MEDFISLYTSDFIYNAGLVGFVRLLENTGAQKGEDYEIINNELRVSKKFLLSIDLAQAYIDTHIAVFAPNSAYTRLLNDEVDNIQKLTKIYIENENKDNKKKLDDRYNFLLGNSGLARASYITACAILQAKNINIDLKTECKKIKEIKDYEEKYKELLQLKEKLQDDFCKETFLMKDIMYSRINAIWSGKSFLNRANAKKDIKGIYYKDFVEGMGKYLKEPPKEKKSSRHCIVCDAVLAKPIDISFLNDSADDMARKKSAFWDYKPDAHLCPICAFVYSLAPLGFVPLERDMIFVNHNTDIDNLVSVNKNIIAAVNLRKDEQENVWYKIWNAVVQEILNQKVVLCDNIQVVVREKDQEKYNFNVIAKDILILLQECMKDIEKIGKKSIQLHPPEYFNVQDAVLRNIFNRNNQYNLLNSIIHYSLQENKQVGYLYNVLMIQQKMTGGDNMERAKANMFYVRKLYKEGQQLRGFFVSDRGGSADVDNKLRGLTFQLLNALQINDDNHFWQIILKTYAGYGRPVPSEFLEGFANSDVFQQLGYAYILGLKSNSKEMEKENSKIEGKK
ncbi:type I-B CRISPR-associated protein Cas8b1/Cst1 [Pectinatus cerevisiiphilus]|uniref:CRISPR-associated protein Cst1 n=1 Tax=Pectinatus cerevisiiphilus TaxID=86956 RepID=A0A4R3K3F8_9FIRM|nr:type I-B CRISPR-associated protein Cas8b1/Cst1 [Pectinatus cerevisiiphilus]TCS77239.1 CRISPR-associated protein Cst1 [Pectinatus cerevisiiphilus]